MIVEMMSSLLVNSLCYYLGSLLCVYNINMTCVLVIVFKAGLDSFMMLQIQ